MFIAIPSLIIRSRKMRSTAVSLPMVVNHYSWRRPLRTPKATQAIPAAAVESSLVRRPGSVSQRRVGKKAPDFVTGKNGLCQLDRRSFQIGPYLY